MRFVASFALLLALLVPAAAVAQSPTPTPTPSATASASATPTATPTPTPTPTATPEPRTKAVQKVYDDYQADGVIAVCKYSVKTLKRTLKTITPQFDTDFPDFRAAVKAGIKRHRRGGCKHAAASPTPTATATPAPTTTPAPTAAATPFPTATSAPLPAVTGRLPRSPFRSVGPPRTPKQATPGRISPSVSPTPGAVATATPTEFGPPRLVVQHEHANRNLTLPGALLGAALLVALLLGISAFAAARSPHLAGVNHAWREAAYRTRGTWRDFSEWLRLGR